MPKELFAKSNDWGAVCESTLLKHMACVPWQIASISSASFLAHHLVPSPQPNARQETWTQDSIYLVFSYLCVLQVLRQSNTACYLLSGECSTYLNAFRAPRS